MVDIYDGPLHRYAKLRVAQSPGMSGTFSPPRLISDPVMHHVTCVPHVLWCMSGSPTVSFEVGGREHVPGIPSACTTRNFTYLVIGPWFIRCLARFPRKDLLHAEQRCVWMWWCSYHFRQKYSTYRIFSWLSPPPRQIIYIYMTLKIIRLNYQYIDIPNTAHETARKPMPRDAVTYNHDRST